MNGQPLPDGHGFPLRLIVPGLYGEKNPKWLTRIELLNEEDGRLHRRHGCGFYKEQGWGQFGDRVPIHSRFDAPQVNGDRFAGAVPGGEMAALRGHLLRAGHRRGRQRPDRRVPRPDPQRLHGPAPGHRHRSTGVTSPGSTATLHLPQAPGRL